MGSRQPTGPACWIGWMAAGFGEKQHAEHPGLRLRRGHGVNLHDGQLGSPRCRAARVPAGRAARPVNVSVTDVSCLPQSKPPVLFFFFFLKDQK